MSELSTKMKARYELPPEVAPFAGHINDVDAHEAMPVGSWVEEFGSIAKELADLMQSTELGGETVKDEEEINAETVWKKKYEKAPGSYDFVRRLEVMDFTGTNRQLIYPGTMALVALPMYCSNDDKLFAGMPFTDRKGYGLKLLKAYNEWSCRIAQSNDRLRTTAILIGSTPDEMVEETKKLLKKGMRAFWMPTGEAPAGLSPADPALDKLWALLADSNSPVLTHIGGHLGFLTSEVWGKAPAFDGWRVGGEFKLDPWTLSMMHLSAQNFLSTMILGGVFERHPTLRFGSAEHTGHWIGPLADNLDRWRVNQPFRVTAGADVLKMKPSEYIRRNVRIMAFDFEPVGEYIDRFGLEEVYCYASDYPHAEGGKNPIGKFLKSLSGQKPDYLKKFFVDNGELLLPN